MLYTDSSALAKLVLDEAESDALRAFVDGVALVSAALGFVEVLRAARRFGPPAERQARDLLARVQLVRLDGPILESAAMLDPPELRSLDAIHIASALVLGEDLEAVVTYDGRMAEAARAAGLRVEAPE